MTSATTSDTDLRRLRQEMRARRRALGAPQQRAAARRLAGHVTRGPAFRHARRIALYIAADGEIDPAPLLLLALAQGKRIYLPVLHPAMHDRMLFVRYRHGDRLRANRYGIPEPQRWRERARPWQLDLVLMPLVAFDAAGNRLGMGGGFYDRTFGSDERWPRRPLLCGLAHRLQRVAQLPIAPWDVPLARIFTD